MENLLKQFMEQMDKRFDQLEKSVEEIKGLKIDVDYLNGKIGKHDMEINILNQRFQA